MNWLFWHSSDVCMYQQFPLDPTCDRNRSVPSYCVGLLEEATRIISKSHRPLAKGMVSVPQNTIRSRVSTDWAWIQPWQASTNIAHLLSFIQIAWIFHNMYICIYVYSVWDSNKEPTSADTTYVSTCTFFAEKPRGWHKKTSKYV